MSGARTTQDEWLVIGQNSGWSPPVLSGRFARLPGIRYVRTAWHTFHAARHHAFWASVGRLNTGYDDWVLFGMWRGWV